MICGVRIDLIVTTFPVEVKGLASELLTRKVPEGSFLIDISLLLPVPSLAVSESTRLKALRGDEPVSMGYRTVSRDEKLRALPPFLVGPEGLFPRSIFSVRRTW